MSTDWVRQEEIQVAVSFSRAQFVRRLDVYPYPVRELPIRPSPSAVGAPEPAAPRANFPATHPFGSRQRSCVALAWPSLAALVHG